MIYHCIDDESLMRYVVKFATITVRPIVFSA